LPIACARPRCPEAVLLGHQLSRAGARPPGGAVVFPWRRSNRSHGSGPDAFVAAGSGRGRGRHVSAGG
jgi:hypothetical protein